MTSAIAVVSLLLAASPAAPPKPHLQLIANPRVSLLPYPHRRHVHLTAVVHNTDERHWCPGVLVDWGDGDRSVHDGEYCEPISEADAGEVERNVVFIGDHTYWSGEFLIRVFLYHGNGKLVDEDRINVTVRH
jgi:hypothetical protein